MKWAACQERDEKKTLEVQARICGKEKASIKAGLE